MGKSAATALNHAMASTTTSRKCNWKCTDGIWYTGCGDAWADAANPAWRHCPLCGLKLSLSQRGVEP